MTKDLTFKESWYKAMSHLPKAEQSKVTMAILLMRIGKKS